MDCHAGDRVIGLKPGRLGDVAMRCMDHQRVAQPAAGDQFFHSRIAAVIAPHEADLYQPLAAGQLRLHNLFAVRCGLRERLFAEHILVVLEAFQHIACVRGVGRGDQHRIDLRGGDQLLARGVKFRAVLVGNLPGRFRYEIRNRYHVGFRHQTGKAADMVAPDRAAADHTYSDFVFHDHTSFLNDCAYISPRASRSARSAMILGYFLSR